jgi:hypothetical protein
MRKKTLVILAVLAPVILGTVAQDVHAFQRGVEHAACASAMQGGLGGWSVKNTCSVPIDLGLAWRVQGSNGAWSTKLTRVLNPNFQIDTPDCVNCVYDLQLRAFYSRDRVPSEQLRPYTLN